MQRPNGKRNFQVGTARGIPEPRAYLTSHLHMVYALLVEVRRTVHNALDARSGAKVSNETFALKRHPSEKKIVMRYDVSAGGTLANALYLAARTSVYRLRLNVPGTRFAATVNK